MSKKNINLTNQSVQEHAQVHVEEHLNYVTDEELENGLSSKADMIEESDLTAMLTTVFGSQFIV